MENHTTKTIILGGVPEHFNAPVQLGLQNGIFQKYELDVVFKEVPEGSGKMCAALRDGSLDVALVLTEAVIRDIVQGSPARLIATYVDSPLTWVILTSPQHSSSLHSIHDLRGKTIGISRIGSGSHLMAMVLAEEHEWSVDKNDLKFVVKNDFVGLCNGIKDGSIDAFMWEKFMTKPYVDKGELVQIGEIVTPWPCFMIAAGKKLLDSDWNVVQRLLKAIQECCTQFKLEREKSIAYVSQKYGLHVDDACQWFESVKFAQSTFISRKVLVKTVEVLIKAKVLPPFENHNPPFSFAQFYDSRVPLADITASEIQTMKSYFEDKRIRTFLKTKHKETDTLTVEELAPYDQLHYHGTETVDYAARFFKFDRNTRILDIGSGLGGPARYLAWKYGCQVTAVELEEKRHQLARELTEWCKLSNKVEHHQADILTFKHEGAYYDYCVSWLSILHIKNKDLLFQKCFELLKPSGTLFIEDFVKRRPFTIQELNDLEVVIACPYVPSEEEYVISLKSAGFMNIQTVDLSEQWTSFVKDRLQRWKEEREQQVILHGESVFITVQLSLQTIYCFSRLRRSFSFIMRKVVESVTYFYSVIANLFANGNLGGIRLIAQKKPSTS